MKGNEQTLCSLNFQFKVLVDDLQKIIAKKFELASFAQFLIVRIGN